MRTGVNRLRLSRGFTLVEVLAAMVFLGILMPAIIRAITIANRASVIADRRSVAAELAENKLDQELVGNAWMSAAANKGDFGKDYPGFRWELKQATWQGDAANPMTELAVEVFFPVQGKEHSVRLTTLVNAANSQFQPASQNPMQLTP